jgi:PAS domain S-box-containing protein
MTRLPSWKGAAPWLLVLILTVILVGLFQRSTGADVAEQARVEALVHEIVALDARLNQDLLKLRHRQLQDYDAVAAADERISALLQRLQAELQRHGSEAMTPVLALWQEKREGLERFKQQNALLRNSQDHFLNLSSQLLRASDSPDGRGSVPHSALLATVGREIMEFLIRGEADDMPAVAADLSALQDQVVGWPLEVRRQVLLMTAHGQQVLRHRLDVESLLNELTGSPFAGSLEASYRDYSEIYRQDLKQAESYRLLLALFALFLIATVVYIMVELKKSALELGHSHAFLDNIANTLAEGILALDRGGRITFANQRAEALLGAAPGGLLGRDAATVLWPGAAPAEVSGLARALATGAVFEGEDDFVRSDGSAFPVAVLGQCLPGGRAGGAPAGRRGRHRPGRLRGLLPRRQRNQAG